MGKAEASCSITPERRKALEFLNSQRGQYILAQALFVASCHMKTKKAGEREMSNISDMEYILDQIFSGYKSMFEITQKSRLSCYKR